MSKTLMILTGVAFVALGIFTYFVEGENSGIIFMSGGVVFMCLPSMISKKTAVDDRPSADQGAD